jgi:hypothetical protein
MAEIYKYSNTAVSNKLYVNGEAIEPDGAVTVNVFDITKDPLVSPRIDPTQSLTLQTALPSEVDTGVYSFYLPLGYTSRDRKFRLVWNYAYKSVMHQHVTYLDVVTPYVSIQEAIEDLGFGSDANDPNYKTYHEIRMAEKYARKMVEFYTGQKFFLFDDTFTVMGNDSDTLPLPRKIHTLFTLEQNDQMLVDKLNDVSYVGYDIEPTTSGFGIRVNVVNFVDNDVYIANGMVPPSIHDSSPNIFRRNKHYDIYARFGWEYVPDEVEQATIEIMRTYFAKDRAWKERYINKISTTDWNFQYGSDAFTGTGSAYADKLLLDYVVTQMVVV